jgi:uncharacterized protein
MPPPALYIPLMLDAGKPKPENRAPCPICGKPAEKRSKPFCSRRCADVDLHRWLSGAYAVPVTEDEEEDERRDDSGAGRNRNGETPD